MTLKELLIQHPEYSDLEVVVYNPSGVYDYLGESAMCYVDDELIDNEEGEGIPTGRKLLVFAAN